MRRRGGERLMGRKLMAQKGLGVCMNRNNPACGNGLRGGYGCRFDLNEETAQSYKNLLKEQKDFFENRIKLIDKKLESL